MTEVSNPDDPPLEIARQGYLFAGGRIDRSRAGEPMLGHLYAEYQIPARRRHALPVVMIHGGQQTGTNFIGTPDGRDGWAQHFLRAGYAVYVVDQPGRGRAAYNRAYGDLTEPSPAFTQERFTSSERFNLYPQASRHTQWPGAGEPGDSVFDQFLASEAPSIANYTLQQELMKEAGAALLDKIGPAILLVHSQSGAFAWPIAQARPPLVRAIVAIEPNGPPVHNVKMVGAPAWFEYEPAVKISGLGNIPLAYEPPLQPGEQLAFEQAERPDDPHMLRGWLQREPARKLVALDKIPLLVVTAEASYHTPYDHCTVAFLRQAGVSVDHVYLADEGVRGNGHMMMIEKNNRDISALLLNWLQARVLDAF